MTDQRELSLRLNAILEMVGASEEMRKFHQHMANVLEPICAIIWKRSTGKITKMIQCGSSYEGTVTPDLSSDMDMIHYPIKTRVVPHKFMAGAGQCFLIVRGKWTRPGYVKLQYIWAGRPLTVYDIDASNEVGFDSEGKACHKSECTERNHGPAVMILNEKGKHLYDVVHAYHSKSIPYFATDWITRHRRHDWPSQQLIDEMKNMGCLCVGVGNFDSPEKDIEWRLSFTLQERRLMGSLNPTQHKVYILLKMVKKDVLEPVIKEESLSSYHCKTCVLFMAETTPACTWVPGNLISCLLQCIELLLQWIRDRFCPSFFLKDSNLFDKEGFLRNVDLLENLLYSMLLTGHELLYSLQCDCVGEILLHNDFDFYRPRSHEKICIYKFNSNMSVIYDMIYYRLMSPIVLGAEQDMMSLYMAELEEYEHGDGVPSYTHEESQPALLYLSPWLHLVVGLEFAARAVTCPDRHEGKKLMKKANSHLQQARNTDLVNVRLARATILLKLEELEECLLLLQELENCWTYGVLTLCLLRNNCHSWLCNKYTIFKDAPINELARQYVASSVFFERSQIELVPPPLCYEMFRSMCTQPGSRDKFDDVWFDRAVVDAKVYLYLLQYLVCSKLNKEAHKQVAIDNLASFTQHAKHHEIHHRDTAFNLLGWVFLQEGRISDALLCFLLSWEIRPHHNAAKFHVLMESFRQAQARL